MTTRYACYFITAENKAEVCFFVDAPSADIAAKEAKARFLGTGYAMLEVWNGSTCELKLKEHTAPAAAGHGAAPSAGDVLVVDDEPLVRSITAEQLREEGFTVTEASSGEDALNKCAAGLDFDLLLTDIRMPDMTGFELANRLAMIRPETRIIYMTGHPVKEAGPLDVMRPGAELLHKPVPILRLAGAVRRALTGRYGPM